MNPLPWASWPGWEDAMREHLQGIEQSRPPNWALGSRESTNVEDRRLIPFGQRLVDALMGTKTNHAYPPDPMLPGPTDATMPLINTMLQRAKEIRTKNTLRGLNPYGPDPDGGPGRGDDGLMINSWGLERAK